MTLSYLNSFLGARIRLIQIWNGGVFRLQARGANSTPSPVLKERGALAQLVEHLHGMQGVSGSNPLGSIEFSPLSKGELGGRLGGFDPKLSSAFEI